MDEFGPLNLLPRPGKQWAPVVVEATKGSTGVAATASAPGHLQAHPGRPPSPRRARHEPRQALRARQDEQEPHQVLGVLPLPASLYPPEVRIAIVMDNFSPHLSTKKDGRVGDWAAANNVELAYVPTNASFLNRIECHFTALRYFALNGTDHRNHEEQIRSRPRPGRQVSISRWSAGEPTRMNTTSATSITEACPSSASRSTATPLIFASPGHADGSSSGGSRL